MNRYLFGAGIVVVGLGALASSSFVMSDNVLGRLMSTTITYENGIETEPATPQVPAVVHQNTPSAVKAIYMSQCVASSPDFRSELIALVEETELNSIIIDVKDFSGTVGFPRDNPEALEGSGCVAKDMEELVKTMHDKGIYVIGRITVFQDPLYTKTHPERAVQSASRPGEPWKDNKGLAFVDVGSESFWDYIATIAEESHALGFDELNFDYVRYPSDGPMKDAVYTLSDYNKRAEELEKFFAYLSARLGRADASGHIPVLSVDLFGMTATNNDDLNIGQVLERAMPYFDAIAPMVYPSHYPSGFHGYANPNDNVYGVVNFSMGRAVERALSPTTTIAGLTFTQATQIDPATGEKTPLEGVYEKPVYPATIMRPWLQDFDYGGDYDAADVRAQIQATYDAGLTSWMLWAPSNRYTRGALLPSE